MCDQLTSFGIELQICNEVFLHEHVPARPHLSNILPSAPQLYEISATRECRIFNQDAARRQNGFGSFDSFYYFICITSNGSLTMVNVTSKKPFTRLLSLSRHNGVDQAASARFDAAFDLKLATQLPKRMLALHTWKCLGACLDRSEISWHQERV